MFCSYVLITCLHTKVSRTTVSLPWVHSAKYCFLSQETHRYLCERPWWTWVSWPCMVWFDCHWFAMFPDCPDTFPGSHGLGKRCAQVGVSAWSSLCQSLFPCSLWQAVNSSLNRRCLPSLCWSSPCWILIQELSAHGARNAESLWFSRLFKFEMMASYKGNKLL